MDLSLDKLTVQPESCVCLRRHVYHRLLGVVLKLLCEVPLSMLCKLIVNLNDSVFVSFVLFCFVLFFVVIIIFNWFYFSVSLRNL